MTEKQLRKTKELLVQNFWAFEYFAFGKLSLFWVCLSCHRYGHAYKLMWQIAKKLFCRKKTPKHLYRILRNDKFSLMCKNQVLSHGAESRGELGAHRSVQQIETLKTNCNKAAATRHKNNISPLPSQQIVFNHKQMWFIIGFLKSV